MDFITDRERLAKPAGVTEKLTVSKESATTHNGKPYTVLVHTDPLDLKTLCAPCAERASLTY